MQKANAVERKEVQWKLATLVDENLFGMEKPAVFLKALACYGESGLDFVDALLWAYHLVEGKAVFTFDDKLGKYL